MKNDEWEERLKIAQTARFKDIFEGGLLKHVKMLKRWARSTVAFCFAPFRPERPLVSWPGEVDE